MPKYYQSYNKKSLQAISKSNYLRQVILSNPQNQQRNDISKTLKSFSTNKKQKYYFIDEQQIYTQSPITPSALLNSFKRIYPTANTIKIDSHSFINRFDVETNGFIRVKKQFNELIDIIIVQKGQNEASQSQTRRSYIKISSTTSLERSQKQLKDYEVYVVHFAHSSQECQNIKWETFVQKYVFKNLADSQSEQRHKIIYSMIFSYTPSNYSSFSILNFVSSTNSTCKFLFNYFDPVKGNQQRLKKLESYLFHLNQLKQQLPQQNSSQKNLPCYSIELKRQRLIPPQHFMEYKKLKQKVLKTYFRLNEEYIKKGQLVDPQMKVQNLVCRFLIQHQYNFQKAAKQISQQLVWQNQFRKNFTMKSFKYWTDQDIMMKIGEDRMGRPVVLFKTYNFFADKCQDVTDYINFLFYFIVVEVMSKCRGYIDDMHLLADSSNNTMRNLKIQVNKRMVPMGLKYCPRMFFKLMPFKCTSLPYYAYALAKPLLPSYSNEIICMVKQGDQKTALNQCLKYMDIQVIPEVIGGKNCAYKDISQKNVSTRAE